MLDYSFRPLTTWPNKPTESHKRKRSTFRAGYGATLDLLETELRHLKATEIVFEADCDRSEIRNDGRLRSNAKLRGPGIIVNFETPAGSMRFPCDAFTDWEDNLRAIALTLEHLRAVNRYGVTQHNEQYKGWTALPDPAAKGRMTPQQAEQWLANKARDVLETVPPFRVDMIRQLKIALHPDRRGGQDAEFKELQQVLQVLGV